MRWLEEAWWSVPQATLGILGCRNAWHTSRAYEGEETAWLLSGWAGTGLAEDWSELLLLLEGTSSCSVLTGWAVTKTTLSDLIMGDSWGSKIAEDGGTILAWTSSDGWQLAPASRSTLATWGRIFLLNSVIFLLVFLIRILRNLLESDPQGGRESGFIQEIKKQKSNRFLIWKRAGCRQ